MMAGLAYALTRGDELADAVKYGVAAGTANTLVIGAAQFEMGDFEKIYAGVEVARLT